MLCDSRSRKVRTCTRNRRTNTFHCFSMALRSFLQARNCCFDGMPDVPTSPTVLKPVTKTLAAIKSVTNQIQTFWRQLYLMKIKFKLRYQLQFRSRQTQVVLPSCLSLFWHSIQGLNCHHDRILSRCWMWDLVHCIESQSRLPSSLSICSTTSALLLRKAINFPFCIMCHMGCLLFRDAWGLVWPEAWVWFRFRFCSWAICPLPCFGETSRGLIQSLYLMTRSNICLF